MVAIVGATNGTKVYISSASAATTVDTTSEYAALTWQQINGIGSIGAFGDVRQLIEYDVLDEDRTRKTKGTANAGNMELRMALDDTDTAQGTLETAFNAGSAVNYAFKVEFNNKLTTSGTNGLRYFRGKVTAYENVMGGANSTLERRVVVAIDSVILGSDPT